MSEGYEFLSLAEIEPVPYHAREGQKLLTVERLLNYRATGINGWTGDPGEPLVPEHAEDTDEELYAVVSGRATFTVDDETVDAPAGTLVHVLPTEKRSAVAREPGTIVLAIGSTPGEPHQPSGWTHWVVADAYRRAGRVDEGRQAIDLMLEQHGHVWHAPYNAACYEALVGDPDAAFEHLRRALRVDRAGVREHAARDEDLASLHDDPRWRELVG